MQNKGEGWKLGGGIGVGLWLKLGLGLTSTSDPDLQSQESYGHDPDTCKKSVIGQSV